MDDSTSDLGCSNHSGCGISVEDPKHIFKSSNTTVQRTGIRQYKWDIICPFVARGEVSRGVTSPYDRGQNQPVQQL